MPTGIPHGSPAAGRASIMRSISEQERRPTMGKLVYSMITSLDGYQNAGQCSGLRAGGEGPRGKAPWGLSVL